MRQCHTMLYLITPGRGLTEITGRVARWVAATSIANELLTLFIRRTVAANGRWAMSAELWNRSVATRFS